MAVVVAREGSVVDRDALIAHRDGRRALNRWPQQVFFWDALPKSGYGKTVKKDIRAQLLAQGPTDPAGR